LLLKKIFRATIVAATIVPTAIVATTIVPTMTVPTAFVPQRKKKKKKTKNPLCGSTIPVQQHLSRPTTTVPTTLVRYNSSV
jgi:hypothetical protein